MLQDLRDLSESYRSEKPNVYSPKEQSDTVEELVDGFVLMNRESRGDADGFRNPSGYKCKQSDDDFQRHNADRHRRQGTGQDKFRQRGGYEDNGRRSNLLERSNPPKRGCR